MWKIVGFLFPFSLLYSLEKRKFFFFHRGVEKLSTLSGRGERKKNEEILRKIAIFGEITKNFYLIL